MSIEIMIEVNSEEIYLPDVYLIETNVITLENRVSKLVEIKITF